MTTPPEIPGADARNAAPHGAAVRVPRATLLLLTFNQSNTVRAAAEACLVQDSEPIEILFSDDASTDDTHAILEALAADYRGPHTVRVRRNATNLGIGAHYNVAIAASCGQLIITAGGDDISRHYRVRSLLAAWDSTWKRADLIASGVIDMSADGQEVGLLAVSDLRQWTGPEQWMRKRPHVIGASHAFTKRMHQHFGDFQPDLAYEDQVMALRATCLGGGITISEPLLCYRRGGMSAVEGAANTPAGFLRWSQRKHARQAALYAQVERDLNVIKRLDLWRGKPRRRAAQSALALRMLVASGRLHCLAMALKPAGAGWLWSLRHGVYFAFPRIAVVVRVVQRVVKRTLRR